MENRERGFSLIEMLVVVVALGFILLGVAGLGSRIRSGVATYGQAAEQHDREEIFTNAAKRDFENVGLNLYVSPKRAVSGQVDALFFPNSDFSVTTQNSSVNILRTGSGINNPLVSGWALVKGSAEMSFAPNLRNGYFTFYTGGAGGGGSYSFYLSGTDGAWAIFSGEREEFASESFDTAIMRSDRVTLALDASANGANCTLSYYRQRAAERKLLYRQNVSAAAYPFQFSIALDGGSSVSDFALRGTLFEQIGGFAGAPVPKLPLFNGVAAAAPVWIDPTGESFTLLGSDPDTDTSALLSPAVFVNPLYPVVIEVSNRLRGSFAAGDYVLLIDDENRKSVLGRVEPNNRLTGLETSGTYTFFKPANPSSPAWGGFWSSPADYVGHQFSTRSRLVKLLPPVTYKVVADDSDRSSSQGNRVIVRREGTSPWERIAFGVSDFKFSDASAGNLRTYNLSFSTVPEDSDSVDPHPVSLSFSPTALNQ